MAHASYLHRCFERGRIPLLFNSVMSGVEFDLLVGTGLSGIMALVRLHEVEGYPIAIVRKAGDNSHSGHHIEHNLNLYVREFPRIPYVAERVRWVFVDDQIASGYTLDGVKSDMDIVFPGNIYIGAFLYKYGSFTRNYTAPPASQSESTGTTVETFPAIAAELEKIGSKLQSKANLAQVENLVSGSHKDKQT